MTTEPLDLVALRAQVNAQLGFVPATAIRLLDAMDLVVAQLLTLHSALIASDQPECWEHASAVDSILYPFGVGPTRDALKEMDHAG